MSHQRNSFKLISNLISGQNRGLLLQTFLSSIPSNRLKNRILSNLREKCRRNCPQNFLIFWGFTFIFFFNWLDLIMNVLLYITSWYPAMHSHVDKYSSWAPAWSNRHPSGILTLFFDHFLARYIILRNCSYREWLGSSSRSGLQKTLCFHRISLDRFLWALIEVRHSSFYHKKYFLQISFRCYKNLASNASHYLFNLPDFHGKSALVTLAFVLGLIHVQKQITIT